MHWVSEDEHSTKGVICLLGVGHGGPVGSHSSPGKWSDLGLMKKPRTREAAPWNTKEIMRTLHMLSDDEDRFAMFTMALGWFPLKRPH